jgi:DNA polymerase-1
MEQNGFKIDVDYLKRMEVEVGQKIVEMEQSLKADPIWAEWQKMYGADNADLGKREQLAGVVFGPLGVKPTRVTKTGRYSTDSEAFEGVEIPFVKRWGNTEKLKRLLATNIKGVLREVSEDGYVHFSLNQNFAITFRSSCSDPNGHAIPNRDPKTAKVIRRAFVARDDDHVILEVDFAGAEVRAACGYHEDPTMIRYIEEDHDMHLDMAAQCYKLDQSQVSKQIRGAVKGGFVFAAFYGDWYHKICQNLWSAVDLDQLKLKDGTLLRQHLVSVGLGELGDLDPKNVRKGTFENHIKEVDHDFWNNRFGVYGKWKETWWADYQRAGYCETLTGFVSRGVFGRNQIINFPIQCSAYNWLQWVIVQLNKWLKEHKMRSRLILQIHDAALLDAHRSEVQDILHKIKELVTVGLRRHWPWINVPLAVESSVCGANWFEKEEWIEVGGVWQGKKKAA